MLTYLACASTRSAPRERIADLLWSNSEPESAFQSIRQARATLKRLTGEELVGLSGSSLTLATSLQCDRDGFLSLLTAGRLAEAVALYRGAFCDGFAASGGDEFERWADVEREALRTRCAEAVSTLASTALANAHASEALALASRLSQLDPYNERHWRIRLETLLLKGDRFGLSVAVAECESWLQRESIEPSRALGTLLTRARRPGSDTGDHAAAVESVGLRADLIGREAQFAALLAGWKDAAKARTRCMVLIGGSGLGKTRLIRDFKERLVASNARVASVRALPADRDIQFAFVSRLAAALVHLRGAAALSERSASILVGLNPSLSVHYPSATAIVTPSTPVTCLEALDELIGVIAEESRLAIIVDDLHWSDPDSARLVASIAERHLDRRVLFVLAMRPREVDAPPMPRSAAPIAVDALSIEETEALLASIARLPDLDDRSPWATLHHSTGGNPLLVLESLRLAMDAETIAIQEGRWHILDRAAFAALLEEQSVITNRVSRLDSRSLHLARVLAAAGRPLPVHALVSTGRLSGIDSAAAVLHGLEMRDVSVHMSDGWSVAHDAVADALLGSASPGELQLARAHAAAALRKTEDPSSIRSALRLYASVGAWDECAATVVELAQPTEGDSRGRYARAIAAMSSLTDRTARRDVRKRLPLAFRYPLRRISVALVVALALAGGVVAARRMSRPRVAPTDAQLVFIAIRDDGRRSVSTVDLSLETWAPSDPIRVDVTPSPGPWPSESIRSTTLGAGNSPSAVEHLYADSGGVDVALWFPDGHEERVTSTRGDDVPDAWAPDRSSLVIESSRNGQRGHRALYVVDLRTRNVRRLTSGGTRDASDAWGSWSPDGARIAFLRSYYDLRPGDFCTVDADGNNEACQILPWRTASSINGWIDGTHVAVFTDSSGLRRTNIVNVLTGEVSPTSVSDESCSVSANGVWIACLRGRDAPIVSVAPVAAPRAARHVVLPLEVRWIDVAWRPDTSARRAISRVGIRSRETQIPVGVGTLLRAEAYASDGRPLELANPRWSVNDTTRGSISGEGVLVAKRPGPIIVRLSAGGWRSAELQLHAIGLEPAVAFRETWDDAFDKRWRLFGEPLPRVLLEDKRRAFWNRGDGDHFSGAYLLERVPAREGVWLETTLKTHITATQWQVIQIFLTEMDYHVLERWDHRTGMVPTLPSTCSFSYPAGEGYLATRAIGLGGDVSARLGYGVDSLARTAWYRVLIQAFPDGRCGVAINGAPVYLASRPARMPDSLAVVLQGNSVGAHVLVGELTVGRGVRTDIPWARLESSHQTH